MVFEHHEIHPKSHITLEALSPESWMVGPVAALHCLAAVLEAFMEEGWLLGTVEGLQDLPYS